MFSNQIMLGYLVIFFFYPALPILAFIGCLSSARHILSIISLNHPKMSIREVYYHLTFADKENDP